MKKTYSTPLVTASDVVTETLGPGSIRTNKEKSLTFSLTQGLGYGL
jgi:hypothetical protein